MTTRTFASLTGARPPASTVELDEYLSRPTADVVASLAGIEGDLVVLGAGGKLGLSLCVMATRVFRARGSSQKVIAVSRFHDGVGSFEDAGVATIPADLLDEDALAALPDASSVIFLAGTKFGSSIDPASTWAMNVLMPALVARRYRGARIVALSTGNVYPFVPVASGGCDERQNPEPVGEYAITCLGRERLLTYRSATDGTAATLVRLNYANALRYGVLVDIALKVASREPVDVTMGAANVIWQGDANAAVLRSFELAASPPAILNVTGPETVSVRWVASRVASLLDVGEAQIVGEEADTALLSNASLCHGRFGYPSVPLSQLLEWTAAWVRSGNPLLGKPTGFQTRDGRF